jgi:hypothetical protein
VTGSSKRKEIVRSARELLAWIAKSRLKQGKYPLEIARFGNLAEPKGNFSGFSDSLLEYGKPCGRKKYSFCDRFFFGVIVPLILSPPLTAGDCTGAGMVPFCPRNA